MGGTVSSNDATLSLLEAISIQNQPQSIDKCQGDSASFGVTVSGSNPTYQWQKDGSNLQGATQSTCSILAVDSTHAGSYQCIVTNSCGSQTSSSASLTVLEGVVITLQPQAQQVCPGNNVSFSLTATGQAPLSYQWSRDGGILAGENQNTLSILNVQPSDSGIYDCDVSNACGTRSSNSVQLTVEGVLTAQIQPISRVLGLSVRSLMSVWGVRFLQQLSNGMRTRPPR